MPSRLGAPANNEVNVFYSAIQMLELCTACKVEWRGDPRPAISRWRAWRWPRARRGHHVPALLWELVIATEAAAAERPDGNRASIADAIHGIARRVSKFYR